VFVTVYVYVTGVKGLALDTLAVFVKPTLGVPGQLGVTEYEIGIGTLLVSGGVSQPGTALSLPTHADPVRFKVPGPGVNSKELQVYAWPTEPTNCPG
jgi:hypothetical protein